MTDYKQKPINYGVHQTHCCILHGCKYGDINCPVESGEICQLYKCEDCEHEYDHFVPNVKTEINVKESQFESLSHKKFYICEKSNYSFIVGQLVEFNCNDKLKHKVISHISNGEDEGISNEYIILSFN